MLKQDNKQKRVRNDELRASSHKVLANWLYLQQCVTYRIKEQNTERFAGIEYIIVVENTSRN